MVLLTCDGYQVIREIPDDANAPAECLAEETRRNDGYAVIASRGGIIVADSEGWWAPRGLVARYADENPRLESE